MRKTIIISLFFIFILILSSFNTVIGADESILITDKGDNPSSTEDNILIDKNGNYYCVFNYYGQSDYLIYRSTDNGLSWNQLGGWLSIQSNQEGDLSTCISYNDDGEQIIWLFYIYDDGGSTFIDYYTYNIDTDTESSRIQLKEETGGVNMIDEITTAVDYNNNVYIIWSNEDDKDLAMMKYNNDLEMFGSEIQLNTDVTQCYGLSADTDANGYLYVSYINNGNLNITKYKTTKTNTILDDSITTQANCIYTDIAINSDGDIYIAYTTNISGYSAINISYYDASINTWYKENIYNYSSINMTRPKIACSEDGIQHVIWAGRNDAVSHTSIIGKRGIYNSWSDLQYFVYSTTDTNQYPDVYYQNFPSTSNGETGFIGTCYNTTDDEIMFFNYGTMISDTPPSEYQQCESPNDIIIVTLQFDDREDTLLWNQTGQFGIKINYVAGLGDEVFWRITNTTEYEDVDVLASGVFDFSSHNDIYDIILFTPRSWMGEGIFSIQLKWGYEDWDGALICSFNVVNTTSSGAWDIKSDKSTYDTSPYNNNNILDLFVKIPMSMTGRVLMKYGDTIVKIIDDIEGTGTYIKFDNYYTFSSVDNGRDYTFYLYNTTDSSDVKFKDSWTIHVQTGGGGGSTGEITETEYNFWLGIGLLLVFTFIGIGVTHKADMSGDAQLGVIILFALIGAGIGTYYVFIPMYILFVIGLLFVGYIVAKVFGGR